MAKTGQSLELELYGVRNEIRLRAHEPASGMRAELDISTSLIAELDKADPWTELFNRTGVAGGQMLISEKLGEDVVPLHGAEVHLTLFRYDDRTFFAVGHNLAVGDIRETLVTREDISPSLGAQLDAAGGGKALLKL